jgi:hypothetical protein
MFTVKIAAIEQQTRFRVEENGRRIDFEVGADVAANLDLDEFMVFEQNEERAREFRLKAFRAMRSTSPRRQRFRLETERFRCPTSAPQPERGSRTTSRRHSVAARKPCSS